MIGRAIRKLFGRRPRPEVVFDPEARDLIAREIWRYQECPWDFDNVEPGSMGALQKSIAVDQAYNIVVALLRAGRVIVERR